jgi:hypothetical protein
MSKHPSEMGDVSLEIIMIEIDKVYDFEIGDVSFGSLPKEILYDLFTDGRVSSPFIERCLVKWFPQLKFIGGRGYDHIDISNEGIKYDAKSFTKRGSNFSPSSMQGKGRKIDPIELWEHANTMIYIFCDIIDFPKVKIIFKNGTDLTKYTDGKIKVTERDVLFKRLS